MKYLQRPQKINQKSVLLFISLLYLKPLYYFSSCMPLESGNMSFIKMSLHQACSFLIKRYATIFNVSSQFGGFQGSMNLKQKSEPMSTMNITYLDSSEL